MSREDLIRKWGPEVILRCCRYFPSHEYLSYKPSKCLICGNVQEVIHKNFDDAITGYLKEK
jgi:hypothetical protein